METSFSEERLDTLFALAIAFCERSDPDNTLSNASKLLSSLPKGDLPKIDQRVKKYKASGKEEQRSWKSRVLGRLQGISPWLDKSIHHSHICNVLKAEPLHLQCFILSRLPADISDQIAIALNIFKEYRAFLQSHGKKKKSDKFKNYPAISSQKKVKDPTILVRQAFLANFVSFEDIYSPKPLDYLAPADLHKAIYLLGLSEVAMACCGISEIENLATFLRQFSIETSQLIVAKLAQLENIGRQRVKYAEKTIQYWWEQADNDTSALISLIGTQKLARAFTRIEELQFQYAKQKLSYELASKIGALHSEIAARLMKDDREEHDLVDFCSSEFEIITAEILLEKAEGKKRVEIGFEAPEYSPESDSPESEGEK